MEWILDPEIWIGLLTLTALEIVLGIDNIVFIYDPDGKGRGTNFLATVLEQSRLNRIAAIYTGLAILFQAAASSPLIEWWIRK